MVGLVGVVLADRYHLEQRLSEGATGEVYRARHVGTQAALAVKVLHPAQLSDEAAVARFCREAALTARVRHPNVIHLFDLGWSGAQLFMAMELLDGHDLRAALDGPQPWWLVRQIGHELCAGLAATHAAGVIHCDIKPENLFLAREAGEVHLKILDFGIAAEADQANRPLAREGETFGTPAYMAPEQAFGAAMDTRADVYAAGCVLFELVTGRPPFDDPDVVENLRQVREDPLPSIGALTPRRDLPLGLEACLAKALARDPDQRFARIEELGAALHALGPGISARGDDSGPIRTTSPRRAFAAIAATIMLALAIALVWGSWGFAEKGPNALPQRGGSPALAAAPVASPAPAPPKKPAERRPSRSKRTRRPAVPLPDLAHGLHQ